MSATLPEAKPGLFPVQPQTGDDKPAQVNALGEHPEILSAEAPTGNAVKHFLREKLGFR